MDDRHLPISGRRWLGGDFRSGLATLLATILVVAACTTGAGDGGPVATGQPSEVPASAGPGETPTVPGSLPPSTEPSPTSGASSTPSSPPSVTPTGTPAPTTPAPSSSASGGTMQVKVYFLVEDVTGGGDPTLVPVARTIPATRAVGAAAMRALVAGPTADEAAGTPSLMTAIPADTLFLGLEVAGGVATVDLSREYESGGGSFSMFARLAQVVYTLTQFPTVQGVSFELDGDPIDVFSGEGIVVDHPATRAEMTGNLPPIMVDSPAWGGTLAQPGRVTGAANVFEATFRISIVDNDGRILADERVMATCGTGCWGTFDVTIPYLVDHDQLGAVIVYDLSAKDGSRENVREYPVHLTAP